MRLQGEQGKIDGRQPSLSAEEEKATAAAHKEPVSQAVHRHEFLLKRGLAERCDNLEFEVGENGRFSDRARVLLAQCASIERRIKAVEAGLIELQLFQLERQLCQQSRTLQSRQGHSTKKHVTQSVGRPNWTIITLLWLWFVHCQPRSWMNMWLYLGDVAIQPQSRRHRDPHSPSAQLRVIV